MMANGGIPIILKKEFGRIVGVELIKILRILVSGALIDESR